MPHRAALLATWHTLLSFLAFREALSSLRNCLLAVTVVGTGMKAVLFQVDYGQGDLRRPVTRNAKPWSGRLLRCIAIEREAFTMHRHGV